MPYRVAYGPPITPKAQKQDNFSRLRALTASFLVAFALLVRLFFPAGCAQLRTILLPDPEDVSQAALDVFMDDLRNRFNNIRKLSNAGRLDYNTIRMIIGNNLFKSLSKITHQAATDTSGVHLGDVDAGIL